MGVCCNIREFVFRIAPEQGRKAGNMTFCSVACSLLGSPTPVSLVAGFPPKPLKDPNATVIDAKLAGASIQVRGKQ